MKNIVILLVVVGLGYGGYEFYKRFDAGEFQQGQLDRCQLVMDNVKAGDIASEQDAWSMWFWGRKTPPERNTLTAWQAFLRDGGLVGGMTARCTNSTVVNADSADGRYAIVDCEINGSKRKIRAVKNSPLTWETAPNAS